MKTIVMLREERNAKIEQMETILAADDFTEDMQTQYDGLQTEVETINSRIERMERLQEQKAEISKPEPTVSAPVHNFRPQAPEAKKEFERFQDMCAAVILKRDDQRLASLWRDIDDNDIRGEQRMDIGSAGGFAVPEQFLPEVQRIDPAQTPLLERARVMSATGASPDATVSLPALDQDGNAPAHQFGGVEFSWIEEGETKPSTSAEIRKVSLTPKECGAHIKITEKLKRNWAAAGSFYSQLLIDAKQYHKELALFSGGGVDRPFGILHHDSRIDVPRNAANTVDYDDISNMTANQIYRGGVKFWLINQQLMPVIKQMANANGNLIFMPDSVVGGSPGTLEGYPIFWYELASARGDRGDIAIVQMDPYYIKMQGGGPFLALGRDGNDFTQNKETLRLFELIDGQPWLTSPYKLADGYEVSPFVFLD